MLHNGRTFVNSIAAVFVGNARNPLVIAVSFEIIFHGIIAGVRNKTEGIPLRFQPVFHFHYGNTYLPRRFIAHDIQIFPIRIGIDIRMRIDGSQRAAVQNHGQRIIFGIVCVLVCVNEILGIKREIFRIILRESARVFHAVLFYRRFIIVAVFIGDGDTRGSIVIVHVAFAAAFGIREID